MVPVAFLSYLGNRAVAVEKSLPDVGRRHGWSEEEILRILRGEIRPSEGQLQVLADEFECDPQTLSRLLN